MLQKMDSVFGISKSLLFCVTSCHSGIVILNSSLEAWKNKGYSLPKFSLLHIDWDNSYIFRLINGQQTTISQMNPVLLPSVIAMFLYIHHHIESADYWQLDFHKVHPLCMSSHALNKAQAVLPGSYMLQICTSTLASFPQLPLVVTV